jgi:exopolysaccharide biosynthesis polyprenyl glycosylphosphotransferase
MTLFASAGKAAVEPQEQAIRRDHQNRHTAARINSGFFRSLVLFICGERNRRDGVREPSKGIPRVWIYNFESATTAQDGFQLQSTIRVHTDWETFDGLRLVAKQAIDLVGASIGLLFLSPVMLAIALLIKLDSPGPALFRQLRRGYRGQLFQVLKFRTMSIDAEQKLRNLEKSNESAGGVLFKLRNDPRVTRLGAFLRRTSLDELPQLINVLRGDMSLVGPRPLQLRDSELLQASNPTAYDRRLDVIPGVTGAWQVGGRSDLDYERMVELDLNYVENWSLGLDLGIICKTFLVVLRRQGAY